MLIRRLLLLALVGCVAESASAVPFVTPIGGTPYSD